jgi:hypothetical protein
MLDDLFVHAARTRISALVSPAVLNSTRSSLGSACTRTERARRAVGSGEGAGVARAALEVGVDSAEHRAVAAEAEQAML